MQLTTIVTILAFAAASVSAAPKGPPIPKTKTVTVTVNKNVQSCGNGQKTYCCFGKLSCSAVGK
jgi:hypothetical protein